MNTAQALPPQLLLASHGNLGHETVKASLSFRLRTRFARFADCFQSYNRYFAEMERSLPIHERNGGVHADLSTSYSTSRC